MMGIALFGNYTGNIIYDIHHKEGERGLRNPFGKRFKRGWLGGSFVASLSFFSKYFLFK
jgi:hypothetical protein